MKNGKLWSITSACLIVSLVCVTVALARQPGRNTAAPPDDRGNIGLTPFEQAERDNWVLSGKPIHPEPPVTEEIKQARSREEEAMRDLLKNERFTRSVHKDGTLFWPSKAYTGLNLVLEHELGAEKFSIFRFIGDAAGRVMLTCYKADDEKADLLSAAKIVFSRTPELNELKMETCSQTYKTSRDRFEQYYADGVVSTKDFDSIIELDLQPY